MTISAISDIGEYLQLGTWTGDIKNPTVIMNDELLNLI